jgi:hypothetical protein
MELEIPMRRNRSEVTGEPENGVERQMTEHNDQSQWQKQGGGEVPSEYEWPTNPKQNQEEGSIDGA